MGVGSWPPQPHLITQTAAKTSVSALLGILELRMRKKKVLKEESFNLPQLLFHCFNNVSVETKQQTKSREGEKFLKSALGNFELDDKNMDEVGSRRDIVSL